MKLLLFFVTVILFSSCSFIENSKTSITAIDAIDSLGNTIQTRFKLPEGFTRIKVDSTSFGFYLRNLPLKKVGVNVYLFNGDLKSNQSVHEAVVDISVGNKDLQQCADAVMRLRSEYLFKQRKFSEIHFNFVSGFKADYVRWRNGERISVGNTVSWVKKTGKDTTYKSFMVYLEKVYTYASTLSLAKELTPIKIEEVEIGDVIIRGGSPGHAITIVDMVKNEATGKKMMLLAQSYMPAQEIHVLKNTNNTAISPWFDLNEFDKIYTPEWTFEKTEIKRFK